MPATSLFFAHARACIVSTTTAHRDQGSCGRTGLRLAMVVALTLSSTAMAAPGQRSASQTSTATPPEPLIAIVSLSEQTIVIHGRQGRITQSRVSSGKPGNATPTGVFSVLQRNRFHESNIYSNAPMPYMQRLTWSGIALHEGVVPGYPASHGCIRLPSSFAPQLWAMGRIGMRVIVSPGATSPRAFAHPALPIPARVAADGLPVALHLAATGVGAEASTSLAANDAYRLAQLRLAQAVAEKSRADKAVKPAMETAGAKSADARHATAALSASAGILAGAEEHRELVQASLANVQTEAAEAIVLERLRIAEAGVKAALDAHEALKAHERAVDEAAFGAARAAREAERAAEDWAHNLKEARRALEPVSVFISRRTGQIYVRQGFQDLYEGSIGIGEPDRPLGTHVYTVTDVPAGGAAQWLAVSVPTSGGEPPRRGRADAAAGHASDAGEALDRLRFPAEAKALIEERLFPGASIIVSDFGLGETGKGTDFVILTK